MRTALVIGLDRYDHDPLSGCVRDAKALTELLDHHEDGSPNWAVDPVLSDFDGAKVGEAELRARMVALTRGADVGDDILLYFAGHAVQREWGIELLAEDRQGISFSDLMAMINRSRATTATVVLDCCYSGDIGAEADTRASQQAFQDELHVDRAVLKEGLSILSACRGRETAAESSDLLHGEFSSLLIDGLHGGGGDLVGRVTVPTLYAHVVAGFGGWQQRPNMKANMIAPVLLRHGQPRIEPALVRRMLDLFPSATSTLRLTPEHEGTRDGSTGPLTPEQEVFDYLGRLRDAGLLTSEGQRAHYWLALESGEVHLTRLGRHYWTLAKNKLL